MPVGVPDFWPGQLIHYEGIPTDGRLDASPTSNWAYDHEHLAKHATFATSASDVLLYSRPVYHRRLSITAYDKVLADFIVDDDWHNWSLPFAGLLNIEAAVIRVIGYSTLAGASLNFRKDASDSPFAISWFITPAANANHSQDFIISGDPDGIIQYRVSTYGPWVSLNAVFVGFIG